MDVGDGVWPLKDTSISEDQAILFVFLSVKWTSILGLAILLMAHTIYI